MEVPDEVGRALPVQENATSVWAWKFTILKDTQNDRQERVDTTYM